MAARSGRSAPGASGLVGVRGPRPLPTRGRAGLVCRQDKALRESEGELKDLLFARGRRLGHAHCTALTALPKPVDLNLKDLSVV